MRNLFLWLALAAVVLIGFAIYRTRMTDSRLNVEPHAAKEIEKAKQR